MIDSLCVEPFALLVNQHTSRDRAHRILSSVFKLLLQELLLPQQRLPGFSNHVFCSPVRLVMYPSMVHSAQPPPICQGCSVAVPLSRNAMFHIQHWYFGRSIQAIPYNSCIAMTQREMKRQKDLLDVLKSDVTTANPAQGQQTSPNPSKLSPGTTPRAVWVWGAAESGMASFLQPSPKLQAIRCFTLRFACHAPVAHPLVLLTRREMRTSFFHASTNNTFHVHAHATREHLKIRFTDLVHSLPGLGCLAPSLSRSFRKVDRLGGVASVD